MRACHQSEARPDKQWVPAGSIALEHNEYVQKTWPSQQRWSFWTATCAASSLAPGEVCNVLQARVTHVPPAQAC